jgi:DNA-binding response OmpR family regulator
MTLRSITQPQPTILVVEDDTSVRQILRRLITRSGLAVRIAPTVAEAIDVAALELFAAVVLDLSLGSDDMAGLQVLSSLRAQRRYADIPMMIFTGRVELPEHVEEQIRRHRAYVFYKPQAYQLLIDQLVRLTRSTAHG